MLDEIRANPDLPHISSSLGEPTHPTPEFISKALVDNLGGLSRYPTTLGGLALREAIAAWLKCRYGLLEMNPEREIIPVNGSREALFAFAQAVIDGSQLNPVVVSPNPFYQIYEGAVLAGRSNSAFSQYSSPQRVRAPFRATARRGVAAARRMVEFVGTVNRCPRPSLCSRFVVAEDDFGTLAWNRLGSPIIRLSRGLLAEVQS